MAVQVCAFRNEKFEAIIQTVAKQMNESGGKKL